MQPSIDRDHALPEGTPGYETRDANIGAVSKFLAGLGVTILVVLLFCWGLFRFYAAYYAPPAPASPFAEGRQLPVGPNLQVNPSEDFRGYMAREQRTLNSYAWVDRQAGTVRLPIDQAIDVLVKKGLPVARSTGGQAPSAPASNATNSLNTQSPKESVGAQP